MNIATTKTQLNKAAVQKGRQFLALNSLNESLTDYSDSQQDSCSREAPTLLSVKGFDSIVSEGKKRKNDREERNGK